MSNVRCASESDASGSKGTQQITCSRFTLEFTDVKGAKDGIDSLRHVQHEARVSYLRSCRWGEQIVFEKKKFNFALPDFNLEDSRIQIIYDPDTMRYRMIIMSQEPRITACAGCK